jgi:purine-cytosine permease-like protein
MPESPEDVFPAFGQKNICMNTVKKIMGLIWMLLAPVIIFFLVKSAVHNIGNGTKDINQPVPWIIIISIFTPIAIGLMIFGYYALKGEYDKLPESSEEIQ